MLGDHCAGPPTRDFGLRLGGMGKNLVFYQRRGKGFDELEVAQVIEHRPTPFSQCGRQVAAGLFEPAGGGRVHARGFFGNKPPQIASVVGDAEPITRRRCGQHHPWVDPGATEELTQIRHVGVDTRACARGWPLLPEGGD